MTSLIVKIYYKKLNIITIVCTLIQVSAKNIHSHNVQLICNQIPFRVQCRLTQVQYFQSESPLQVSAGFHKNHQRAQYRFLQDTQWNIGKDNAKPIAGWCRMDFLGEKFPHIPAGFGSCKKTLHQPAMDILWGNDPRKWNRMKHQNPTCFNLQWASIGYRQK